MKILVKIKNDRLCFITRKKLNPDYKNMLNTNVISNNELVFSDEYIFLNQKIICTFFNELIKNYSITTLSFQSLEVLYIFLPFLSKFKGINSLYLESDEIMPYKLCERLCKINNIKYNNRTIIFNNKNCKIPKKHIIANIQLKVSLIQ